MNERRLEQIRTGNGVDTPYLQFSIKSTHHSKIYQLPQSVDLTTEIVLQECTLINCYFYLTAVIHRIRVIPLMGLGLDIRLLTTNMGLELEQLQSQSNVLAEVVLGTQTKLGAVALVALNVQTDSSTTATSTGQTDNNAAAVVELDVQTLVLGHTAVQVSVGEVTSVGDLAAVDGGASSTLGNDLGESLDDLVGAVAVDVLVVVAGEESAAVGLPEVVLDGGDAGGLGLVLGNTGDDVQPGNNSPDTVLLADVVAASSETLLATDGDLLVVEQVAEELPASGDLVALQALSLSDTVNGAGGGHGAGKTVDTLLLEPGDQLGVVGNDGQAVTGGNKSVGTVDHVTVTITVTGSTEVDAVLVDSLDELVGVDKVRVGVTAAKVRLGLAVHGAGGRETELLDEDVHAVGASDTVHTIEEDLEVLVGAEEVLDQVKVEDLLHHGHVVGSGVDDLDLERTVGLGADDGGVDIGDIDVVVGGEGLGGFVDLVGNGFRGGGTVGQVVLDTEVVVGAWDVSRAHETNRR